MGTHKGVTSLGVLRLLVLALLLSLVSLDDVKPALADPGKLAWTIVDTPAPGQASNIIVSPSEVNVIAIGSDGRTFYAVDIPNNRVYKSTDGGITWLNVTVGGASLPVWNIAVAPDDVNFVVAITTGTPNGPKMVFISIDGGANWENTNFPALGAGEYISCVDISREYVDGKRDVAIGTRDGAGNGGVYVAQTGVTAPTWKLQELTGDIVALKFSPTYASDTSLVVISANGSGIFVNLGIRDTAANTTAWNTVGGYPVLIRDTNYAQTSPTVGQLITADLELPSDFLGTDSNKRRYYVSTDVNTLVFLNAQSGVHRIDNTVVHWIRPPITAPPPRRAGISSIAYWGTYDSGILLAGEVTADPATGKVHIWRTSSPTASTPTWEKSDPDYKSPTGGGNSGFANAQLAWIPDGVRAYCGTSSANPTTGGTGPWPPLLGQWPRAWLNPGPFDESAFSVSPYSPAYELSLAMAGKPTDADVGHIWNQLSLIDTQINRLSDVAVLEAPEDSEDYNVLYLASINSAVGGFDSVWRSTSDPLGRTWERILCIDTTNDDIILRVKQTSYEETTRSTVIAFADRRSDEVGYSRDEGQVWNVRPLKGVSDLALASDEVLYILSDTIVYRYKWMGNNWMKTHEKETYLDSGHTIAVPLKNPENEVGETADWVIVGEQGPPSGFSRVAYADFSTLPVAFQPPLERRVEVPVPGDVHIIADDRFERNKMIYAGSRDAVTGTSGKIYRWVIGESTDWDELEPPNSAFYGLAQRNDVLYGTWNESRLPSDPHPGVDRTLYSRATVPPPPEWDGLTAGLPVPGDINFPVAFTCEPSSLKVSSNEHNTLWAIDNRPYNWTNKVGCLWAYTDTVAKVGPWTTSPASGDFIPIDPVSGRAKEVDFRWRQLSYASVYELQIAKDREFSIRVLVSENITPVDQLAPACFFPSCGLVPTPASEIANWGSLESGHTYYWRVRVRGAVTGEIVRSPWSATMYFTIEAGLPARTKQLGPALLGPVNGARGVSPSPAFSWSPMPGTTRYEFILAKDAALTQLIVKVKVPTTAYKYDGKLEWNAAHFWQVRALEPIASEPSPVASFTVITKKAPMASHASPSSVSLLWACVGIATIYVALVVAIVVLIKRRYV
jgi:hypothetical protein